MDVAETLLTKTASTDAVFLRLSLGRLGQCSCSTVV